MIFDVDATALPSAPEVSAEGLNTLFNTTVEGQGLKPGQVLQALRTAVTGGAAGPDLFETLVILGVPEVAQRLRAAVAALPAA